MYKLNLEGTGLFTTHLSIDWYIRKHSFNKINESASETVQGLHFYKKQYVLLLFKNHIKSHTTHTLLENNNNKKTAQELQAQNRTSNINMQDKINKKKVTDKVLIDRDRYLIQDNMVSNIKNWEAQLLCNKKSLYPERYRISSLENYPVI